MDNTNRFDGKADIYAKARPKYAAGLFDYLKGRGIAAGSVFADIGSGTGIFTEQLLHCGYWVYAVEPNGDMRQKAEVRLSGNRSFVSVNGMASHTGLPEGSVDFVTAAQAFHWFDADGFRKECQRILKPGGKVILVYNVRDEKAAVTQALAKLRQQYNPEFHGFSNGMSDAGCRAFFAGNCDVYRADNTQIYDRNSYVNRVLSSSYSLKETDNRYRDYLAGIHEIFDAFSTGGFIAVPTETVAYIGECQGIDRSFSIQQTA